MNDLNDFFKAQQDDMKYKDVCEIHGKDNRGRTNTNVLNAFSGLECKASELYEWNSKKKDYNDNFRRAKQCLQRRITTMKKFNAKTDTQKEARQRHIYPIQVAYAYGKNCLKKTTSKRRQKVFENSVDKLISNISIHQPNIKTHLGNSIEKSIHDRGAHNAIRSILNKTYYDPEQINVINKERNVGYLKLNKGSRELYNSIFDEGFSRNVRVTNYLKEANENEANAAAATATATATAGEKVNENTNFRPSIKTMRRRAAKRKTAKKTVNRRVDLRNIDTILRNEGFATTDRNKEESFKKIIKSLEQLYQQYYLNDLKFLMLNKILKINSDIGFIDNYARNVISKINLSKKPKMKSMKSIRPELDNPKYIAFENRQIVIRDINNTLDSLERRLRQIDTRMKTTQKTGNKTIDDNIHNFLGEHIDETLLYSVDEIIAALTNSEQEEINSNIIAVNTILTEMEVINSELLRKTDELHSISLKLDKAKVLAVTFANNPALLVRAKEEEVKQKAAYNLIELQYTTLYNTLTVKIRDATTLVSRVYDSPQLLVQFLEDKIIRKRTAESFMALRSLLTGAK
jgi:hypothetical protein